ncbi:MobA/MobL family protein [Pseudoxanthomonas sp.]|uniref:MobA/MobL family protein n=1 Tax=Pseudoxanthomonas sp. TaxID=1871049 RepID=UPI0028C4CA3A|nr:MobA/MobL family protein [Pseudoxanthomonas sp.]
MAIYHTRVKTFSRAKGHSSVAAAAYRAGLLLVDEKTGARHDYRRRGGVVETRCVVPTDAPDWSMVPARLWCAAEHAERRKDATVAREFEIALPHELDDDQRSALAAELTRALVDRYQFAAQASIHSPDAKGGLNWHLHVLATTRRLDSDGLADKTRELDGGPAGRAEVEWVREMVARVTNAHLAAAQIHAQVDHRSLEAQAAAAMARGDLVSAALFSRRPTQHVGKNASALARRGEDAERVERNAVIQGENDEQFEKLLQTFERAGRAMASTDGHGLEQARRDRQRANPRGVDLTLPGGGQMRGVQGITGLTVGQIAVPPRSPGPSTQDLFGEAVQLWLDDTLAAVRDLLKNTRRFLEDRAGRLATFAEHSRLRTDLRELVKRLRTLKRWATEWKRRQLAERHALKLLHRAEHALEEFVESNPKPADGTDKDWARRRGRRLAAIEQRLVALKAAREARSPEAEAGCEQRLVSAVEAVEDWSGQMLKSYPIESDALAPAFGPVDASKFKVGETTQPPRLPRLH